ncbi:hypothetical protein ACTVCO_07200 [Sanguibacter sp. A247]|uniref:hypothetical protein n=1 Tax=unclassified Sanguibacter TaxID=2645534 RepID=UPI003FD84AA5
MTSETPLASQLAHAAHAALDAAGIEHTMDWGEETFTLTDGTVGVVTQVRAGITVYAVADDVVPQGDRERVALASAYLNSRLSTTAVEIDMALGLLAVRSAVATGDLTLLPEDLGGLIDTAAHEVRATWALVREPLAGVVAGTVPPATVAAVLDA